MKTSLSDKFWETPTKIKDGYLKPMEIEVKEEHKFMEIRDGKVVGWGRIN